MKKNILLFTLLLSGIVTVAQTKLSLKINHKLGSSAFAYNAAHTNNLGNSLDINRLQYYLTVVSITHDGGAVKNIDKVILVDANTNVLDSLTSMNITTLESVTIAVGVKSSLNHLDPSTYSSSHPLAPKSPSMHWGWTPGYRFVALEGKGGTSSPSQVYEIHSLGDVSYFNTTITTAGVTNSGEKVIELNADYLEALRDIDVTSGILEHGETSTNKKMLSNFRDFVFTSVEGNPSVGIEKISEKQIQFNISPNPTKVNKPITIDFEEDIKNASIMIVDIKGRIVLQQKITSKRTVLTNLEQGIYICSIKREEEILGSKKLIVTK